MSADHVEPGGHRFYSIELVEGTSEIGQKGDFEVFICTNFHCGAVILLPPENFCRWPKIFREQLAKEQEALERTVKLPVM